MMVTMARMHHTAAAVMMKPFKRSCTAAQGTHMRESCIQENCCSAAASLSG